MRDFRGIPQVDALSREPRLAAFPEPVRRQAARLAIQTVRDSIQEGRDVDAIDEAVNEAHRLSSFSMGPVINASGVVLHTGLGRARLAPAAVARLAELAGNHVDLEIDMESGSRGDRQLHTVELLKALTGAEDAIVVNNAAAGLVLTLQALAFGREVILSRGQMVEIGGSFRIPEIVAQSGCRLREVGCTNKTRLSDYSSAVSSETGALLRCHTSNYKIVGFTSVPTLKELVALGKAHGLPVIDDQGTGCLVDTSRFGLARVPTVGDSVAAGATVTIASCDKLLGGPQGGMVLGTSAAISRIKGHPLARAFRVDKLTLLALEATLKLYAEGREREVPTINYLSRPVEEVAGVAERIASACERAVVEEGVTEIGGGSAPGTSVPTMRVGLSSDDPDKLAKELRLGKPSILGRIESDRVWLDPRTLEVSEVEEIACRLKELSC